MRIKRIKACLPAGRKVAERPTVECEICLGDGIITIKDGGWTWKILKR